MEIELPGNLVVSFFNIVIIGVLSIQYNKQKVIRSEKDPAIVDCHERRGNNRMDIRNLKKLSTVV